MEVLSSLEQAVLDAIALQVPEVADEDGPSLQDQRLDDLFGPPDERTRSWVNATDRLVVTAAHQTNRGDVTLELTGGHAILLFPASAGLEAWRLFAPDAEYHVLFPEEPWRG
jgi:hypothetical protein